MNVKALREAVNLFVTASSVPVVPWPNAQGSPSLSHLLSQLNIIFRASDNVLMATLLASEGVLIQYLNGCFACLFFAFPSS